MRMPALPDPVSNRGLRLSPIAALMALCISLHAAVVPADRVIPWRDNVGVPGGIPNRTTVFTTLLPGATTAQINAAIANCPPDQVVRLAAGTFNNIGTIVPRSHVVLRGAGPGRTVINSTAASNCIHNEEWPFGYGMQSISSGYTKGSTSIVLPNATGYAAGMLIRIDQNDDPGLVFSATRGRNLAFTLHVESVTGNTVTFSPPLPYTLSASLLPKVSYIPKAEAALEWAGIEDLTINNTGDFNVVWLQGAYASWLKNVEMVHGANSFAFFSGSVNCEMRRCSAHDAINAPNNSDGFGVYLYDATTYCLIEDNIFHTLFVGPFQTASSANAFVYNYTYNGVAQGFPHQIGVMNGNHGAHNMMTLWEGNIGEQWQSDGYHGSASHQTLLRNWIHGLHPANQDNRKMIDLCRGTYYTNVLGNILGAPSWNPTFSMTGEPGYNEQSVIYRLGYPNMANNALTRGGPRWPDLPDTYPDSRVTSTLLRHGNYDYASKSQTWDAGNADHAIPDSFVYTSKPAYFGTLAWPPFDPAQPGSASKTAIPAGYRFWNNGNDPPSVTANVPPVATAASLTTVEDTAKAMVLSATDADGDALTYAVVNQPAHGTLTGTPPTLTYRPALNYAGADSFTFTAHDGGRTSAPATVSILVTAVNDRPKAIGQGVTTRIGQAASFALSGSDAEGSPLTYAIVTGPAHGTLSGTAPDLTYTPTAGFTGADSCTFTVHDGALASTVATVSFTINAVFAVQVNFQPATAPSNPGWLKDSGGLYAARNGQTYGWDIDLTAARYLRDRNAAGVIDQEHDTHILVGDNGRSAATWQLAVPNGAYQVTIVMGDSSDTVLTFDNHMTCTLEGLPTIDGIVNAANNYLSATVTVTVTDGQLSLVFPGGNAVRNKLCSLVITTAVTAAQANG